MASRIIHSGRLPEFLKAFTTFRRLASFFRFASLVASRISTRSSCDSSSTSMSFSSVRIASAPISARKPSPYSSRALR